MAKQYKPPQFGSKASKQYWKVKLLSLLCLPMTTPVDDWIIENFMKEVICDRAMIIEQATGKVDNRLIHEVK